MSRLKAFEDKPAPVFGDNLFARVKEVCPDVFLICFRSKNKNVVVYQARVQDGKLMDPPVEAYWLILEPSYQAERRSRNIMHDREDLGFFDVTFAWGFSQERQNDTTAKFAFDRFKHDCTIKITPKGAQLFTIKNDSKYLLRSMFVEASESINIQNLQDNCKMLYFSCMNISKHPPTAETVYIKGGP